MVLLDERYFRDTLPCSARESWCVTVLVGPNLPCGKPQCHAALLGSPATMQRTIAQHSVMQCSGLFFPLLGLSYGHRWSRLATCDSRTPLQLAHVCMVVVLGLLHAAGADKYWTTLGPVLLMWFGVKTTLETAAQASQAPAAGRMTSGMHGAAR
jgi:hypothetical protein